MIWRLLFLFITAVLFLMLNINPSYAESYFYYRQYLKGEDWTKEKLLIQRDGPWLKQQWGLENDFHLPYKFLFEFDAKIRCSVCSFSDPPEEIHYGLEVSRVNFGWLKLGIGHGRIHNLSREDTGSYKGFGIYRTYLEAGILLK